MTTPQPTTPPYKCPGTMSGKCYWSETHNNRGFKYCIYCGIVNDVTKI